MKNRSISSRTAKRHPFLVLGTLALFVLSASPSQASTFGINAHVPLDPIADEIVEAGITWVRVDFEWMVIEPERDAYSWQRYDRLIDRLEARGLRIYASFGSTPGWATSGSAFSGVPKDSTEWQEFCYLVASRYRGRVDAWGIWNEPNLPRFWEGTRTQYLEILLLPAIEAIRTADPGALICAPDLAHLSTYDWADWLTAVIQRAGGAIDIVTHHIYPSYGRASEITYDLDQKPDLPLSSPSVRDLLRDTGWWGRPFWLTETGIETEEYSENRQATFYENLLADWFGPHPEAGWMDRIFFYHMFDGPQPAPTSFGIIEDGAVLRRKPAFFAYQHFISEAEIDDAEIVAHAIPAFIGSDSMLEVSVTVRNTGTTTWTAASGHIFDLQTETYAWAIATELIGPDVEVPPGETHEFWIEVQAAPDLSGEPTREVTLEGRMILGNGHRFGDPLRLRIVQTDLPEPAVTLQPRSVTVREGSRTHFAIETHSESPVRYRWRRNSVELEDGEGITGSRTKWLRIRHVDQSLVGDFDCIVTNDAGSVFTLPARLSLGEVLPYRPTGRLSPN
jgi:hypothetical protein